MSDGIREFLNGVALGTIESPEDTQESAEKEEAGGRVKLMTLHASKGLEFDTVFIIGVNPGLLPMIHIGSDVEPCIKRRQHTDSNQDQYCCTVTEQPAKISFENLK